MERYTGSLDHSSCETFLFILASKERKNISSWPFLFVQKEQVELSVDCLLHKIIPI